MTRAEQTAEIEAYIERIRIGTQIAAAILKDKPLRYPVQVQAKAVASGMTAMHDLLAGVLDGNADALDIARAVVAVPAPTQPAPAGPAPAGPAPAPATASVPS